MVTRRRFIKEAILTTSIAPIAINSIMTSCNSERKIKRFGFISGIIGKELERDWKSALKSTVELGYTEFEGVVPGITPNEFANFCNDIGLAPVAGGIGFNTSDDDTLRAIDVLIEQNMKYAVTYWPWLTGGPFSADECRQSADILNRLGELCKQRDITLCWHNHDKEFIQNDKGMPFDLIMSYTDPSLVKCEMDIYWVKKGGADPLAMLKKYPGRISILHVKDMAPGDAMDFECPGSGIIDFGSVFNEAANQGIQHYFVERDNVIDGMACLKSSAGFLKELRF